MQKVSEGEYNRRLRFAREKVALAWCAETTKNKEMDVTLAEEFAKILVEEMYNSNLGCATTDELLEEIRSRVDLNYSTVPRISEEEAKAAYPIAPTTNCGCHP
jgi:hypothetical protein